MRVEVDSRIRGEGAAVTGRPGSFERFCEEAHPRLVAAIAHHGADPAIAEDCAQEALVRARQHWGRVSALQSPLGWCFRVGVNLSRSWRRRRRAEQRAYARHGTPGAADEAAVADQMAVREALATLPARQREVLVLRYFLGLSAAEAAEATGSTAGAVRVRSHRAVAALREQLRTRTSSRDITGASS